MNAPSILTTTEFATGAGSGNLTGIMRRLGDSWCRLMHDSLMWPIHGQYQCRRCGRRRPVPWAQRDETRVPAARQFETLSARRYGLARQL